MTCRCSLVGAVHSVGSPIDWWDALVEPASMRRTTRVVVELALRMAHAVLMLVMVQAARIVGMAEVARMVVLA